MRVIENLEEDQNGGSNSENWLVGVRSGLPIECEDVTKCGVAWLETRFTSTISYKPDTDLFWLGIHGPIESDFMALISAIQGQISYFVERNCSRPLPCFWLRQI